MSSISNVHWELEQLMGGGAWSPVIETKEQANDRPPGRLTFYTLDAAKRYAFRNWSSPKYVRIIRVVKARFLEE